MLSGNSGRVRKVHGFSCRPPLDPIFLSISTYFSWTGRLFISVDNHYGIQLGWTPHIVDSIMNIYSVSIF